MSFDFTELELSCRIFVASEGVCGLCSLCSNYGEEV